MPNTSETAPTDQEFLMTVNARYMGQWHTFDWNDPAAREQLIFDLGGAIGLAMRLLAQANQARAALGEAR